MTRKQLEGLLHAPSRTLRNAATAALAAMDRSEEAQKELRECQERVAALEMEKEQRVLVVLHRDGFVEVWGQHKSPVRIAEMPDLPGREEEAEQYMLHRLPAAYRDVYETGQRLTIGSCKGCLSHTAYKLLKLELALLCSESTSAG